MQPALDHLRKQHPGLKIRRNPQRLQPRGQRTVRAPAIKCRHQPHRTRVLRVHAWILGERGHHPLKVARADGNVRVVDEQEIVTRMRHKLNQRTDFAVGSQPLRTFDQANHPVWKLALQLLHRSCRRIVERRDGEEHFVLARIILPAMAAKRIHHAGVKALEGFENADVGRECRELARDEKRESCGPQSSQR